MAAMARSLGIPARVAVGFLTPSRSGRATYDFSSDDMHAWPELYFSGAGWVRFEPTPGDRAEDGAVLHPQTCRSSPSRRRATAPARRPARSPSASQDPRLDEGALPEDQSPQAGQGFPWPRCSAALAGGAARGAAPAAPPARPQRGRPPGG